MRIFGDLHDFRSGTGHVIVQRGRIGRIGRLIRHDHYERIRGEFVQTSYGRRSRIEGRHIWKNRNRDPW